MIFFSTGESYSVSSNKSYFPFLINFYFIPYITPMIPTTSFSDSSSLAMPQALRALGGSWLAIALLLILWTFFSGSALMAVTKTSLGTGSWHNASNWDPVGVPTAADDVVIEVGHVVQQTNGVGPGAVCNNLLIKSTGLLVVYNQDFDILGLTTLEGSFFDFSLNGQVTFYGLLTVIGDGSLNTTNVVDAANLRFQAGINHSGNAFDIEGCTFEVNDQSITGNSSITFNGTVVVGSGLTLTTNSPTGTIIGNSGSLIGADATATLANQSLFIYRPANEPMATGGVLDFSAPGNTVRYERDGDNQKVAATTYHHLEIGPDPLGSNLNRVSQGAVQVNGNLSVEENCRFQPQTHDLTVLGQAILGGSLYDDAIPGLNTFQDLVFQGGNIDGQPAAFGVFQVNGNLDASGGDGQINEAELTISGLTTVGGSQVLEIAAPQGTKTFEDVQVLSIGTFRTTASSAATTLVFNGPVSNAGIFSLVRGNYTFFQEFLTTDKGVFLFSDALGDLEVVGPLINHGTFSLAGGDFVLHDQLAGSKSITFNGDVTVAAGQSVTNVNTAGVALNGLLNGADGAATFVNQQMFTYNPSTSDVPMLAGTLDATSAGNTFRYGRVGADQVVKGITYHNLELEAGTFVSLVDGDVSVAGNLVCNTQQNGPGSLILMGNGPQSIGGTGQITDLEVNKPAGTLSAISDVNISSTLNFMQGVLSTGGNTVNLGNTALLFETNTDYVLGNVATSRLIGAGGASDFGGLGLAIFADAVQAPGQTDVTRSTGNQALSGGILRTFSISPATNTGLNASLDFTYRDDELNGLAEANLVLLHNTGSGFNLTTSNLDLVTNTLSLTGINSFQTWTAGDPGTFPVELLTFSARARDFDVQLAWETASELNNDFFEVERSLDGVTFGAIGQVAGAGTTPLNQRYEFLDAEAMRLKMPTLYYRLRQVDFDGSVDFSPVVKVTLEPASGIGLEAFPSPFSDELNIRVGVSESSPVQIRVFDLAGKVLWEESQASFSGQQTVIFQAGDRLSPGVYLVRVDAGNRSQTLRVIKR